MLRSFRARAEDRKNFRQKQVRGVESENAEPPSVFASRRVVHSLPKEAKTAVHEYTQCVKATCTRCNGLRQKAQEEVRKTTKITNTPLLNIDDAEDSKVFTSSKSGEAPRTIGLPKSANATAVAISEVVRENDVSPVSAAPISARRAIRVGARPSSLGLIRGQGLYMRPRTATSLEDGLFNSAHGEKTISLQADDNGEGFDAAKVRPRWNYEEGPTYGPRRVTKPTSSMDIHGFEEARDSGVEELTNDRLTRESFTWTVRRANY